MIEHVRAGGPGTRVFLASRLNLPSPLRGDGRHECPLESKRHCSPCRSIAEVARPHLTGGCGITYS